MSRSVGSARKQPPASWDMAVVCFALALPTAATLLYFVVLSSSVPALQKSAYAACKTVQFALPLVWAFATGRLRWHGLSIPTGSPRPIVEGVIFGLAVGVLTWIGYRQILLPLGLLTAQGSVATAIHQKLVGFGLTHFWGYLGFAAFASLIHSLLEEYYWRWFVFGTLRRSVSSPVAIWVASVGFASHHVVILATYFGWTSPLTWALSAAVAIGGAYWCWLYERSGSLLAPWLSHALVDVAIFAVGYELLRGTFV